MAGMERTGKTRRGAARIGLARQIKKQRRIGKLSNNKIKQVKQELDRIRDLAGGLLTPQEVVKHAKDKNSFLHKYFEWNNNRAAECYRIEQARHLIRMVYVKVESNGEELSIRGFVSLTTDRPLGYRDTMEVVGKKQTRTQLLQDVYSGLGSIQRKLATVSAVAASCNRKTMDIIEREIKALPERTKTAEKKAA